jgi:hypothetical protein
VHNPQRRNADTVDVYTLFHDMLRYLVQGAGHTLLQLLGLMGPLLGLAGIMQILSTFVGRRCERLLGHGVFRWLTAPGTVIHELGHAMFCIIFRHPIVEMKLFRPRGNPLGYVKHTFDTRSRYQAIGNFFIALGPIWLGTTVLALTAGLLLPDGVFAPLREMHFTTDAWFSTSHLGANLGQLRTAVVAVLQQLWAALRWDSWRTYVFIYVCICVGCHITLSRADLKGAGAGFRAVVITLLCINWLTLWAFDLSAVLVRGSAQVMGMVHAAMVGSLILIAVVALSLATICTVAGRR